MTKNSKIEWTNHTFNPWIGCTKVSPACANCYAERDFDNRHNVEWGPTGTRIITRDQNWENPLLWNQEAESLGIRYRVFCASLSDVFEDWQGPIRNNRGKILNDRFQEACNSDMHNDELLTLEHVRKRLFRLIDQTPYLDWLLLTKRPENIHKMWHGGPRPNIWLGTSVENQEYANIRIPRLLGARELSPVLFLSCEPMVGPVDLRRVEFDAHTSQNVLFSLKTSIHKTNAIDWVITGGESGPQARPAQIGWFRSLRDQCAEANKAFLFKQWGEFDDTMTRVGKRVAGRKLDGRTHDSVPILMKTPEVVGYDS